MIDCFAFRLNYFVNKFITEIEAFITIQPKMNGKITRTRKLRIQNSLNPEYPYQTIDVIK